jgi:hypothetical protein
MPEERSRLKESTMKLVYNIAGTISLLFAFIGIILPVLPTTPFVLISAACYYKGSEKLHNWLLKNPFFGPIIMDYEKHRGMKKTTKIKALLIMWSAVLASSFFILETLLMRAIIIIIAFIGTVVMIRVKTIID